MSQCWASMRTVLQEITNINKLHEHNWSITMTSNTLNMYHLPKVDLIHSCVSVTGKKNHLFIHHAI